MERFWAVRADLQQRMNGQKELPRFFFKAILTNVQVWQNAEKQQELAERQTRW